jgi:hypothetical protein
MRPELMSSTSANPTCATTSVLRALPFRTRADVAASEYRHAVAPCASQPQHSHDTEEETREERDRHREQQHRRIDRNLTLPWQMRRRKRGKHAERRRCHPQSHNTAAVREHAALEQQTAREAHPAGPQSRTDGQFLMPTFRSHEHQVGHVRAGNQQHDADGSHHDPEHVAHVADRILLERPNVRRESELVELLRAHAGWCRPPARIRAQHPSGVGIGLGKGDAGLQSRDATVVELPEPHPAAIESKRQEKPRGLIQEAKCSWQHTDHFVRHAVEHDAPANDRRIYEAVREDLVAFGEPADDISLVVIKRT